MQRAAVNPASGPTPGAVAGAATGEEEPVQAAEGAPACPAAVPVLVHTLAQPPALQPTGLSPKLPCKPQIVLPKAG